MPAGGVDAGREQPDLPLVKICGVCRREDAVLSVEAGAAYIGVILAPGRARSLRLEAAAEVLAGAAAERVGVFVDAAPEEVLATAEQLRLDVVQLHGAESPAVAGLLGAELSAHIWKAIAVRSAADIREAGDRYAGAVHGLLLDGWSRHGHGGVGASFDWAAAAEARAELPRTLRVIVAGGLNPDNVGAVVSLLNPDVVDVSSGVEDELRRKSAARVREFIAAARGERRGEG
jgi:phosphoribosylanthranilate isomerase